MCLDQLTPEELKGLRTAFVNLNVRNYDRDVYLINKLLKQIVLCGKCMPPDELRDIIDLQKRVAIVLKTYTVVMQEN